MVNETGLSLLLLQGGIPVAVFLSSARPVHFAIDKFREFPDLFLRIWYSCRDINIEHDGQQKHVRFVLNGWILSFDPLK